MAAALDEPRGFTDEEITPFCHDQDTSTKEYFMQQTMVRVKDPRVSIEFYTKVLGMTLLHKLDFPYMKFTLYFVGYANKADIPIEVNQRKRWALSQLGTVELTHNYGTETQSDFQYHDGNSQPQGFGHIGIAVPDVYAACERFEKYNVPFVKKPDGGKMKGLAFIKDPDGYWIEIFNPNKI